MIIHDPNKYYGGGYTMADYIKERETRILEMHARLNYGRMIETERETHDQTRAS